MTRSNGSYLSAKGRIRKRVFWLLGSFAVIALAGGLSLFFLPLSWMLDLVALSLGARGSDKWVACSNPRYPVRLTKAFSGLPSMRQVIGLYQAPGDSRNWYLIVQEGIVYRFQKESAARPEVYLDLRDRVESGGETGLLGLAFAPDYPRSRRVYLSYTTEAGGMGLRSRISVFTEKNSRLVQSSERIILEVRQPEANHNGGGIAFGPDGYLYIGLGDGGGAGDRHGKIGHGQNKATLLGAFLRIEPLARGGYRLPPGNPFVHKRGRPEIYAWGLRNPWRWSFDRRTGELWAADVGQNKYEEINIIKKGKNYGWRLKEGFHCYNPKRHCGRSGLADPVYEYSHKDGRSVTGGYVYRGRRIPKLYGIYIFTDFYKGPLWGLVRRSDGRYERIYLIDNVPFYKPSFAEGNDGELYLVNYAPDKGEAVYALQACR